MSSQQKRGFRLPWAAERSTEDAAGAATLEAESADPTTPVLNGDGEGGELGEGPFHFADAATPAASTDAPPEAPDVPETAAEAGMLNTESAMTESATTEAAEDAATTSPATDDTWLAVTPEATESPTASENDTLKAVEPDAEKPSDDAAEPATKKATRSP